MNNCLLAIGTNVGERHSNINDALSLISQFSSIVESSSTIETQALMPQDAPSSWNCPFINIVVYIKTNLSVFDVFTTIKEIERKMGRDFSTPRWSPRIIDIDIIFFNTLVFSWEHLTIPHPQMHQRTFVLQPMCEILPNFLHPVFNKTIKDLLSALNHRG